MTRVKLFIPLLVFAVIAGFLLRGLSLDPTALPSALIGKPLPEFTLPSLSDPQRQVQKADIVGTPFLLNVWATWCPSCRSEHGYMLKLSQQGVRIVSLNYKDDTGAALKWLQVLQDPYELTLYDSKGVLGLDLGVYGAPETFVVDADGMVRHRHVGVVNERVWQEELRGFFPNTSSSNP